MAWWTPLPLSRQPRRILPFFSRDRACSTRAHSGAVGLAVCGAGRAHRRPVAAVGDVSTARGHHQSNYQRHGPDEEVNRRRVARKGVAVSDQKSDGQHRERQARGERREEPRNSGRVSSQRGAIANTNPVAVPSARPTAMLPSTARAPTETSARTVPHWPPTKKTNAPTRHPEPMIPAGHAPIHAPKRIPRRTMVRAVICDLPYGWMFDLTGLARPHVPPSGPAPPPGARADALSRQP